MSTIAVVIYITREVETDPASPLQLLEGRPMVEHVIQRVRQADPLERLVLAAPGASASDPLATLAGKLDVGWVQGPDGNLPALWTQAAAEVGAEHILPVGANQPLIDPELLASLVKEHQKTRADYTITSDFVPAGTSAPLIRAEVCRSLQQIAPPLARMDTVMAYLQDPAHNFQAAAVRGPWYLRDINVRLVVESAKDHELLGLLYGKFWKGSGIVPLDEIIYYLGKNPGVAGYNLT
jgi:spore coat polysaccharide biosynthesis protein SpsF